MYVCMYVHIYVCRQRDYDMYVCMYDRDCSSIFLRVLQVTRNCLSIVGMAANTSSYIHTYIQNIHTVNEKNTIRCREGRVG